MPLIPDLSLAKSHPDHRAARKAYEKEHHLNLDVKDVGLKAAVLVLMAGLACYPKIKAEANIIEREQQLRREKQGRDGWKSRGAKEGRGRSVDDGGRRGDERGVRGHDDGERASRRSVDEGRRLEGQRVKRLEDGRGESRRTRRIEDGRGHDGRTRRFDDRSRRSTDRGRRETDRERDSRRWEEGSSRTSGSDRTQDWLEGGYEYVNADGYRGDDRRRR